MHFCYFTTTVVVFTVTIICWWYTAMWLMGIQFCEILHLTSHFNFQGLIWVLGPREQPHEGLHVFILQLCVWHRWSQILLSEERSDNCMCYMHCFQWIIWLSKGFFIFYPLIKSLITWTEFHTFASFVSVALGITKIIVATKAKSAGRQPYNSINQSHVTSFIYSTEYLVSDTQDPSHLS